MTAALVTTLFPVLFIGASWLSPEQEPVRAAERLLSEGKAEAAVEQLGQALADNPDSAIVAYNLGNAHYRAKQYEAAVQAYRRVRADKAGAELSTRAAYNSGNALFRLGQSLEQERPQDALTKYAEALVEYRRALGLDPTDADAKFNYEYTSRKLEELRKRLEEMAKQQPTPENQESAGEPTPKPESQQGEENQQPQSSEAESQTSPDQSGEQSEERSSEQAQNETEEQTSAESAPEPSAGESSVEQAPEAGQSGAAGEPVASSAAEPTDRQEARALIDTARQEELSPAEFWRQQQHGVVAEPAQDW
ncbi:hypothetical protein HRbin30_03156 [bacterium HR30]|nr:hypothetical protein HRbin30_03156 [bacterium HR30]